MKSIHSQIALEGKLLLHVCCAPCSCYIIEKLTKSDITFSIFFYNPNIDTQEEYLKRKNEVIKYANKLSVNFIDSDYDNNEWMKKIVGLENEPEKGKRCSLCFYIRLEKTALFAYEHGFNFFSTSLGISRWKNFNQVCESGYAAAKKYPSLTFFDYNWRKLSGAEKTEQLSKQEKFYRQKYCGCTFSHKL